MEGKTGERLTDGRMTADSLAPVLPNGSCGSSRPKRSGKLKRIEEILLSCEILLHH
jgi:hypothetical protein